MAAAFCALLLASGLAAVAPLAPAAGPRSGGDLAPVAVTPMAATEPESLEAPDEESATRLAYRKRQPVLVTGLTSETSETFALPDGTLRSTVHLAPVRMKDESGDWVDVDLTLERHADGSVAPRAHPRGLRLSGSRSASSDSLVAVGHGEQRTELGWRGPLPEPVLDGHKATYVDVRPGIDLVVEGQRTGFEFFLVVKNRQAASALGSVAVPWRTGSLRPAERPGGGIELRSAAGDPVVQVPPAQMWDAVVSPVSGEHVRRADVPMSLADAGAGTDLVLTPAKSFLDDPAVVFPVTVDPAVVVRPAFDAFVQDTYSSDQSGSRDLKLGYNDDASEGCGSGCKARSFLRFDGLEGYSGSTVVKAELFLWNYHSWSCTAAQWEAWRTDGAGTAARWNHQPTWREKDGTSTVTRGHPNCADGWVSVSVQKTFQMSFTSHWSSATVGLKASTETHHNGWKRFLSSEAPSGNPYVELTYNRTPSVPTNQSIDSCYTACGSPAVVRSGTPTLTARVSDPDGGTLRLEFEVYDNARTTPKARSGTSVTGAPSGTYRSWKVVPLSGTRLPEGTFHWRVKACDYYVCGGYSGWFTFTVDTVHPSLPTVTGTPYTARSTGTWNGGPGVAGSFTFGPNGATGVTEYAYSLNNGPVTKIGAGTPQAEQLTPNQQQVSTDLTGFSGFNATLARATDRGHNSGQSLRITPTATPTTSCGNGCTFAAVGGDNGGMRLGMQAGKRYQISGWIYVPAATGLSGANASWSLRMGLYYHVGTPYYAVWSSPATAVDTWQRLSLTVQLPAGTTQAFLRLFNGFAVGQTSKAVYFDDLSVRQLVGDTTTVPVTPTADGTNVMSVQSIDGAGNLSDPGLYEFLVRSNGDLNWYWSLDENQGTSAASAPANNRPGVFGSSDVDWSAPGRVGASAISLPGTGELTTVSPVLDTTHTAGFTVAAWVRLTDATGWRTAVSQDGAATSMFRLGFRNDRDVNGDGAADPAWCFTVKTADSASSGSAAACTTDYVVEGDWIHLVGVYDRPNSKIKLYVNGTTTFGGAYAEADAPTAWAATGKFAIGRAWNAAPVDRWVGDIDEVYAEQEAWTEEEISLRARP
ncbi:MAG TPA: LamG-like jellyroll fold domain-containing protein [Pilimelia sp.]|nr:LamG-like jellyroll fold domain-containing protein [Pilimelia sp.]